MTTPLATPAAEALTQIDPNHLEAPAAAGVAAVVSVNEHFHNDTHPGTFRVCGLQPCYGVNRVVHRSEWEGA